MPVKLQSGKWITPKSEWQNLKNLTSLDVDRNFYISVKNISEQSR